MCCVADTWGYSHFLGVIGARDTIIGCRKRLDYYNHFCLRCTRAIFCLFLHKVCDAPELRGAGALGTGVLRVGVHLERYVLTQFIHYPAMYESAEVFVPSFAFVPPFVLQLWGHPAGNCGCGALPLPPSQIQGLSLKRRMFLLKKKCGGLR